MGVYEDRQIHTKTGFQPIKSQDSQFALHANRTTKNKNNYVSSIILHMPAQYTNLACKEPIEKYVDGVHVYITHKEPIDIYSKGITQRFSLHTIMRKSLEYF